MERGDVGVWWRDLKAGEGIELGWEWDDGNAVHMLPVLLKIQHMFP